MVLRLQEFLLGFLQALFFFCENTPPNCGSNLRIVRRRFYD
jgi:hypothetical protein